MLQLHAQPRCSCLLVGCDALAECDECERNSRVIKRQSEVAHASGSCPACRAHLSSMLRALQSAVGLSACSRPDQAFVHRPTCQGS